jgi:hypothetical protein
LHGQRLAKRVFHLIMCSPVLGSLSPALYKVSPGTKAPLRMLLLVFFIDALLCCMPLVNSTAFAAITGITTIGFQISYALPIALRLTTSKDTFIQTPAFHLGRFSQVVGWVSVVWLTGTSILLFFPTNFDAHGHQTPGAFNYTCVVGQSDATRARSFPSRSSMLIFLSWYL